MEDLSCRYCKESVLLPDEIENVISPCRCRGSLKLVHIECLDKWGKSRCEICKFKYYEKPLQPVQHIEYPLYIEGVEIRLLDDNEIPPESDDEDNINISPIRTPREELLHLIDVVGVNIPLLLPSGFRMRYFYLSIIDIILLWNTTHSITNFIKSSTLLYLWLINETYRTYSYRMNICEIITGFFIYSLLGLIVSPLLFIYYYIKTISNRRVLYYLSVIAFFQEIWNWYNDYTIYNYSLLGTINNIYNNK